MVFEEIFASDEAHANQKPKCLGVSSKEEAFLKNGSLN